MTRATKLGRGIGISGTLTLGKLNTTKLGLTEVRAADSGLNAIAILVPAGHGIDNVKS